MSITAFLFILISVFLHAGWNFLSKANRPSMAFFMLANSAIVLCTLPFVFFVPVAWGELSWKFWALLAGSVCFEVLYAIGLANAYKKQDISMDRGELYRAEDENVTVILPFSWGTEYDLTTAKNYDVEADITADELVKGYQSIWGITPDCAYNTIKCAYLTEKDSYSFWDINTQKAYIVSAMLKKTLMNGDRDVLIYEKDGICGFVSYF